MNRIDETKPFKPVNIAVLTVSDTRTLETDKSGDTLVERITRDGHVLADRAIVTDDIATIRAQVRKWIDDPRIEAVITTGGTGVTGRDVTPEALEGLFEKKIEGFGETVPLDQLPEDRHLDHAVPRHRRRRQRHLSSSRCPARPAPAGTAGTTSCASSSTSASALQLRRADAAPERRQDAPERLMGSG